MAGRGGTAPTKNGPNIHLHPPAKYEKNPQFFAFFQVPPCFLGGGGGGGRGACHVCAPRASVDSS